jgi:hypothetical protein
MDIASRRALLKQLLQTRSSQDVSAVLRDLGDTSEQGLDRPFGPFNLCWKAFGDNPSNESTVGLGTKPGKSLTERITNAIDALLELRASPASQSGIALPSSARRAAEEWFGRTITGPEQGLFRGMPVATDRRISVTLLNSGDEQAPTIDVIDDGVGLSPEEFPSTILSLQHGNKIRKRYLIGAFGQGGSASMGFASNVLVVSRRHDEPERIGFTVVRVLRLDTSYKEDCYAYLALWRGDDKEAEVLSCTSEGLLNVHPEAASLKLLPFERGTLVRHFNYRLNGINKSLAPSPGNLYHYLHYSVFDPILPFRVVDLRIAEKARNEYVAGGRNRLMKLATEKSAAEDDAEARVQVRHHRPMEYVTPVGDVDPCIGVEYWVVLAYRKKEDKLELRANSAELFVQPNYPILGTLNGQTQGELSAQLLRECGLTLLSKHMVVHIDASDANSQVRRQLFSSSREGFKDGPVLEGLVGTLRKMIQDDEALAKIEQELTERLAKREMAETREEVRQQVARLLKDAGFKVSDKSQVDIEGTGPVRPVPRERVRPPPVHLDPLPTLPYPQVTRFEIVHPEDLLQVRLNDSEMVIVETDADQEFDTRGLVHIRTDPPVLEIETKSKLRGGRIRWRLRPKTEVQAGVTGEMFVSLTRPDGSQLIDSRAFEVLPAQEKPSKQEVGQVPPFEITPINPEDDSEIWGQLWPNDMDAPELQATHAYKVWPATGKMVVFYSTIFAPYAEATERLKTKSPALFEAFVVQYEIWIAYHAILQYQHSRSETSFDPNNEKVEPYLDQERALVARMQIKQAQTVAELLRKAAASAA